MTTLVESWTPRMLLRHGVVAGVIAAVCLGLEEAVATILLGSDLTSPFRLVASLVFGAQSLRPEFPTVLAVLVGGVIHVGFSVLFAWVFLFLIAVFYQLSAQVPLLLVYGVLFGLAVWILNVLTVLRLVFPQLAPTFGLASQIWNGIVGYGIFYGLVLGVYVVIARPGVVADWKGQ